MAKKKKKKSSPPVAKATSPQIKEQDLGGGVQPEYTIGSWSGIVQYSCNLCAFDFLKDEQKMLTHLMEVHNSEAALEKIVGLPKGHDVDTAESTPTQSPGEVVMLQEPEADVEYFEVEVTEEEKELIESLEDKDG